jgi:hypothetical protein
MKYFVILFLFISCVIAHSQPSWQREAPVELPLQLFSSPDALNLPTTETLQKGDIYFHISHKFLVPVSEGIDELFGFDGSVYMRLGLGYGITDELFAQLGRSNLNGNIDLQLKWKVLEINSDVLPLAVAVNGGVAYNSKVVNEPEDKSRLWQYYGFIIANTMVGKSLGLGISPGFLYNANLFCEEPINSWTMGAYAQYFFDERWSVIAEANPTLNGWRQFYNTYSLGMEIETAGHFFKVALSNNVYTNFSQFMTGSLDDKLHITFLITRVL